MVVSAPQRASSPALLVGQQDWPRSHGHGSGARGLWWPPCRALLTPWCPSGAPGSRSASESSGGHWVTEQCAARLSSLCPAALAPGRAVGAARRALGTSRETFGFSLSRSPGQAARRGSRLLISGGYKNEALTKAHWHCMKEEGRAASKAKPLPARSLAEQQGSSDPGFLLAPFKTY